MIERDWRGAGDLRRPGAGLAVLIGVAAALRFWALGSDVPHAVRAEETDLVHRAIEMMRAGTLNPGFFESGPLAAYLQLAVSIVRFVLGAMSGEWHGLAQLTTPSFYVWGRAAMAALGVATVLLTFQIAMRWSVRHAWLAAGLLAVLPLHVLYSQRLTPDVLLTCLVALTVLLSMKAAERPSFRAMALAGAAAGLCAATRHSGALAIVMPLTACCLASNRDRLLPSMLTTLAACGAALAIGAPYTFLDLPGFLESFAQQAYVARQLAEPQEGVTWYYLGSLQQQFAWPGARGPVVAVAWPAVGLLVAGVAIGIVHLIKGPQRSIWSIVLVFAAVHVAALVSQRRVDPRFLLPIAPLLCTLVAAGLISVISFSRRYELSRTSRAAVTAVLTVAMLAPATTASIADARQRSRVSTVRLTFEWIRTNVAPDATLVVEGTELFVPRYVVARTEVVDEVWGRTLDDLASTGAHYLITNSNAYGRYLSAPSTYREQYLGYTRLFSEAREVVRFSPGPSRPGPELRVLKILP